MIQLILLALVVAAPVTGSADVDCKSQYKAWLTAQKDDKESKKETTKAAVKARDKCEAERYNRIKDCKANEADFNEVITKVNDACSKIDIKASSETGAISCVDPESNCDCNNPNNNGEIRGNMKCPPPNSPKLKNCPGSTDKAAELNAKKLEKTEDRVEKLQEKISKLEGEKLKASNDKGEKRKSSREARAKSLETYQQAVSQAEETASNNQKAMYEQMNGYQKEMLTAYQGVTDANLKDSQAFSALQEQNMRIELECSKRATAVVNGRVTEAIAGIKTGTYNRGDQANLFRQVGLTDRQNWQAQARVLKRQCMDDEETHASFKSAQMAFEQSKKVNGEARKQANDHVDMLKQNMNQLQNPAGCTATAANGAARQTQACTDAAMVRKKLAAAERAKKAADKAANQDDGEGIAAAQKTDESKDKEIVAAKAQLDEQEKRSAALKEAEKAFDGYPNAGGKATEARDLDVKTLELEDKAGRINFCCNKVPKEVGDTACSSAEKFMEHRGFDVKLTSIAPQSGSSATTTAPNEAAPTGGRSNQ